MTNRFAGFDAHVEQNQARFLDELREYCRTPCITGQGVGVRESAALTAEVLRSHGITAQVLETAGAPVVYGEIGSGARTLLIYDHYDVQPPEPLELWESEPFAADIRDGKVYARGVADNRGDVMARVQAIETYRAVVGELPIKVKFLIEGEEEIGSPSLPAFVESHRELLQADGCLWEAGSRDEEDRVLIALGLKGVLHLELRVKGANVDLHSSLATIVPNAAWKLTWALASLKTPDDRIAVDGLMAHVFEPTAEQIDLLRRIPFAEEKKKGDLGIAAFNQGLSGVDLLAKHLYEPTCTIQGLLSGYTGVGLKAVSPCEAMAKVEFRLVPNLEPDLVLGLLRAHLDRRGFDDVEIVVHAALSPAQASPSSAVARAAIEAAESVEAQPPVVYPLMAGSGPMSYFSAGLGMPVVSAGGISWHDCRVHAPNESIRIKDYLTGIRYIGRFIDRFAVA
ncbi:MAG: hypothetical protein QOF01_2195 [Thermomicrobiales bacterium]|nr:hypothetical protein [Thermomicrobiales bacterium]MEA2595726.1 hypothetical protein [Thermomicrobiales bacterium]